MTGPKNNSKTPLNINYNSVCLHVCLKTALGNPIVTGESTHCRPGWTDSSFDQSDNTWTAFPQDASDAGRDVEQWWPTSAVEARRDGLSTNHSLVHLCAVSQCEVASASFSDWFIYSIKFLSNFCFFVFKFRWLLCFSKWTVSIATEMSLLFQIHTAPLIFIDRKRAFRPP